MMKFIENIGDKTINSIILFYQILHFTVLSIFFILNYRNYNSKTVKSIVNFIYYIAISALPIFLIIASVLGFVFFGIFISVATKFNLQTQIGFILVNFVVNEFSPLFTTFFISLRSTTLIDKEFSSIDTNLINNSIIPLTIGAMFSMVSLSVIFIILMIVSGYIFTFSFMGMDFYSYKHLVFNSIEISNILILFVKALLFGFVVMIIPIYYRQEVANKKISLKVSTINTKINTFLAIFFVEIFFLLLMNLISKGT